MTVPALDDQPNPEDPPKGKELTFSIYQMCMELAAGNMDPTKFQVCPLVDNPRHDCYCLAMTRHNIEKMVRYCSGDYEQCAIYRKSPKKRPHTSQETQCPN